MTSYTQGTRLEYDLMKLFRDKGYYVIRSAGSHGLSDLIVITKTKILLIQAKKHEKLREQEREEELCSLAKPKNMNKKIEVYTAWYSKERPRKIILQNLIDRRKWKHGSQDWEMEKKLVTM